MHTENVRDDKKWKFCRDRLEADNKDQCAVNELTKRTGKLMQIVINALRRAVDCDGALLRCIDMASREGHDVRAVFGLLAVRTVHPQVASRLIVPNRH